MDKIGFSRVIQISKSKELHFGGSLWTFLFYVMLYVRGWRTFFETVHFHAKICRPNFNGYSCPVLHFGPHFCDFQWLWSKMPGANLVLSDNIVHSKWFNIDRSMLKMKIDTIMGGCQLLHSNVHFSNTCRSNFCDFWQWLTSRISNITLKLQTEVNLWRSGVWGRS